MFTDKLGHYQQHRDTARDIARDSLVFTVENTNIDTSGPLF